MTDVLLLLPALASSDIDVSYLLITTYIFREIPHIEMLFKIEPQRKSRSMSYWL